MASDPEGTLVRSEARKVCGQGHTRGWRPWYRTAKVLGHCVCGSPYTLETRGPEPLEARALAFAGDWVAIEFPKVPSPERVAEVAVRAYLNETENRRGQ